MLRIPLEAMVDRSEIYLIHNRILYEQKAIIHMCAYTMENVYDVLRQNVNFQKYEEYLIFL